MFLSFTVYCECYWVLVAIVLHVCFSMQDLFVFEISSVTELVLGGNAKAPLERLKWKTTQGL